jgi:hypothetical protein
MINREDWNGKRYEEMAEAMHADLVMYRDKVASFTTIEDCEAEEQELMQLMDESNNRLVSVKYELPKEVSYNDKTYSKKDVTDKLIYFINKLEVKYENTLGLYQLVNIWKKDDIKDIQYHVYDSTLRCLNQVTFKGYTEWTDILIVNEYLSQCHNEYSLDTGMMVYLSECHNAIVNKMDELNKENATNVEFINEGA